LLAFHSAKSQLSRLSAAPALGAAPAAAVAAAALAAFVSTPSPSSSASLLPTFSGTSLPYTWLCGAFALLYAFTAKYTLPLEA
jgi:hypothetical protein